MRGVEKLVPELRFPDFEGDWVTKKMGDTCKIKHGFAFKGEFFASTGDYVVLTPGNFHPEGGFRYQKEKEKYYTNPDFPKEYILDAGELLTVMTEQAVGLIGSTLIVPESGRFLHNQRLGLFSELLDITKSFLFHYLKTNTLRKIISNTAAGTKVRHTSPKKIEGVRVIVPSIPEQSKIASFLSAVDKKIEKLTRKKELLEKYKKGVMQKIFSREIRFKDEDGKDFPDWEEQRLGEICDLKRGASPRPISDPKWFDSNSKIGWVRISDVTNSKKYLNKTVQYLSSEGISKSRLVEAGNIIMSICATIGKPIYTQFQVCIHDGFVVFENLKSNKEYLFYYLENIQEKWYRYGQPGTQVNLNTGIVGLEKMPYPAKKEQKKIANFLSTIDKKIKAIQTQLTQTQEFKKGLLQKMFV